MLLPKQNKKTESVSKRGDSIDDYRLIVSAF